MTTPRYHKDLIAWQKARRLAVLIYHTTAAFPKTEQHGLMSQTRRAAISVLSNISEGAARGTNKEFRRFLYTARGSLAELEAQLLVAEDLGFLASDITPHSEIAEVGRLINGLLKALQSNLSSG